MMKVGIVGCGNIAGFHLPHILRHTGHRFVSVVDVDLQKAEGLAKRFGLSKIYQDLDKMLYEHNPAVVHILTPPFAHAEFAIKAMESGCHVLVEKPMALTVAEADAMLAAAQKNEVKLCVDHNFLFDPNMVMAKELVQKGKVGRVVHVEVHYGFDIGRLQSLSSNTNAQNHWLLSLPGGLLADLLPHPSYLLLHFVKNPLQVWAVKKSHGILPKNLPDELRVLVEADNMTGLLSISLGVKPDSFVVTIYGTEMTVQVNLSNMTLVTRQNRKVPKSLVRLLDNVEQAAQLLSSTLSSTFKIATGKIRPPGDVGPVITQFYESISNGAGPPVSGDDGKAVVKFMTAIEKCANEKIQEAIS